MSGSDKRNDNNIRKAKANEPIGNGHEINENGTNNRNHKQGTRCLCAHTIARAEQLVLACQPHNSKACSINKF